MIDITENESKLMNFPACRERERETKMEDINQTGNGKSISCGCFHFQLQCLDADFEENPILNKTSNVFVNHTFRKLFIEMCCHKISQSKTT